MRKIDLPITRRFATQVVDMREAYKDLASGKKQIIPLGTIDFGVSGKELDQARINGGLIIWSTICLEEKLELIITRFLFHPLGETHKHKGREFFSNKIIKADLLSYSAKKGLTIDIVNSESLLKGREKSDLEKALKDIMDYRNAFAHGDIIYEAEKGCILSYWMAGSKTDVLTEEYWKKLEHCFDKVHSLVDKVIDNMEPGLPTIEEIES